ncbi:hypothetical protein [Pyrobaculum islandicum]|uniref:hypothetical protein n=1 Tax=Pyrobaculum islandicum TaxID=2277 RepID=UPI001433008F|nr:hypothetical protein [Pyrobaculum islandicum]
MWYTAFALTHSKTVLRALAVVLSTSAISAVVLDILTWILPKAVQAAAALRDAETWE